MLQEEAGRRAFGRGWMRSSSRDLKMRGLSSAPLTASPASSESSEMSDSSAAEDKSSLFSSVDSFSSCSNLAISSSTADGRGQVADHHIGIRRLDVPIFEVLAVAPERRESMSKELEGKTFALLPIGTMKSAATSARLLFRPFFSSFPSRCSAAGENFAIALPQAPPLAFGLFALGSLVQ